MAYRVIASYWLLCGAWGCVPTPADNTPPQAIPATIPEPEEIEGEELPPAKPAPAPTPKFEKQAPSKAEGVSLRLGDLKDYEALVTEHRGKVLLVDFWATWCLPCREQFRRSIELSRKYEARGLVVVSISLDQFQEKETEAAYREKVLTFLREANPPFANWAYPVRELPPGSNDAMELACARLEIDHETLPHLKLYDRQGELVKKFFPDLDNAVQPTEAEIEQAVVTLLE